jgi:hypothetical protein
MRVMKGIVALLVAAALAVPSVTAHHARVTDPRDTRGPLDVRVVRSFGTERPGWRITTYARWSNARIWDRGFVVVRLNTRGDRRANRYIVVTSDGRRLHAHLWQLRRNRRDRLVGRVAVWRPNRRTVTVRLPFERLNVGPRRVQYQWWVQTLWMGRGCPQVCIDRVPDRGRITEPLQPEPEPTPTEPTPEPSPEPSP